MAGWTLSEAEIAQAPVPEIVALSIMQLSAYNRADLEAFCACYHEDIAVLEADGSVRLRGMTAFRERYAGLFSRFTEVQAEVDARLHLGTHVVERERWSRRDAQTGEVSAGWVLVRYTLRDGKIGIAEFLP